VSEKKQTLDNYTPANTLDILLKLHIKPKPKKVILLYGPSMVGKSFLATLIARDYLNGEGLAIYYGSEPHYADEDYKALITSQLRAKAYINYTPYAKDVFQAMNKLYSLKDDPPKKLVLILDSLSMIAQREAKKFYAKGITESRVIAARVVPLLNAISTEFKEKCIEYNALGIMITHAGSTAGSGKYRGVAELKPSMSMRTAHNVDYILLLDLAPYSQSADLKEKRRLTVVASRYMPGIEGKHIDFSFEELERGKK